MEILELEIRKRLGQIHFDPINEQEHLRFDFGSNEKINDDIIKIFDHLFEDIIILEFYKGQCSCYIEELTYDWHNPYKKIFIKDYSGYGTVSIIKDLILTHSKNYKSIIREEKIEQILKIN